MFDKIKTKGMRIKTCSKYQSKNMNEINKNMNKKSKNRKIKKKKKIK